MQVSLVVKKGPKAGQTFPLPASGETVVGRSPKVQIPITEDTKSSRRHARFALQGGKLEVADMGSANGTVVNGEKISGPVQLFHGDKVVVGLTVFVVEAPELSRTASAAAPTADPSTGLADADADAMEETRRVVVDDSGQPTGTAGPPAPAAAASAPAAAGGKDALGDELELDFDETGQPTTSSGSTAEAKAAEAPVDRKELARRKARERAEAAAAAEAARVKKAASRKAEKVPGGAEPPTADAAAEGEGEGGVDWTSRQRDILRAKGAQRPNLVQRALGDLGPLTSDFGSQSFGVQLLLGTVLLALLAGMFAFGMWIFGGCEPEPGARVIPVTTPDTD